MLKEVSPFTEPISVCTMGPGNALGYTLALNQWFWFSCQTTRWLGADDYHPCRGSRVVSVDVLAPTPAPEHRWPVFLVEARQDFFKTYQTFGKGDLLRFLFMCCSCESAYLKGGRFYNLLLLEGTKVAAVHFSGNSWHLHVTDDVPYMIEQGTRIFALL